MPQDGISDWELELNREIDNLDPMVPGASDLDLGIEPLPVSVPDIQVAAAQVQVPSAAALSVDPAVFMSKFTRAGTYEESMAAAAASPDWAGLGETGQNTVTSMLAKEFVSPAGGAAAGSVAGDIAPLSPLKLQSIDSMARLRLDAMGSRDLLKGDPSTWGDQVAQSLGLEKGTAEHAAAVNSVNTYSANAASLESRILAQSYGTKEGVKSYLIKSGVPESSLPYYDSAIGATARANQLRYDGLSQTSSDKDVSKTVAAQSEAMDSLAATRNARVGVPDPKRSTWSSNYDYEGNFLGLKTESVLGAAALGLSLYNALYAQPAEAKASRQFQLDLYSRQYADNLRMMILQTRLQTKSAIEIKGASAGSRGPAPAAPAAVTL